MMTTAVRTYVWMVCALAAGLIAVALRLSGVPQQADVVAIAAFALALAIVQKLPVPFPRGTEMELVRVEEAVVVPLVVLLEPLDALLAVAFGVVVGQLIGSNRPELFKLVFNAAQLVVSVAAALAVTAWVAGDSAPGYSPLALVAAVLGLVAMFAVNQLLVAGVMRMVTGTPLRRLLADDAGLKAGMWVANAAIGMLLVLPAVQAPGLLLVALVPLVMLHAAWRVHADHARDEQRLRELGSAVGEMSVDGSLERVARHLAASAREVADSSGAEVRLFDEDHTWWVRRTDEGIETGDHVFGTHDRGEEISRVAFTVPLAGSQGVFGELCVWHDRDGGDRPSRSFARRDRTMIEMLGHQASTSLDNSLLAARAAQQQRTIAQVFQHSSEGMLVLDRRGRVRGWNPAMCAIAGFEHATVDASPISLLSPQLASIVKSSGPGVLDAVISTADGSRRHVRASYARIEDADDAIDAGDEVPAWVVVVRDVTQEQETVRLQDDFVATVSHELRTPLTAIKGFLQTMQRDDIELGAGQVRMFLQIMGEQADRLERLIGDLLDMSAIESGRPLEVEAAPCDLQSTVHKVIAVFEAARPNAHVLFDAGDAGLVVEADAQRLEQVLTNLLDNAYKHGGQETPISVRVSRTGSGSGAIAVTDQGPGISLVDQRRIFDRFFVSADSVTRQGGGAGLGLYICRKLVSAMEGNIDVTSHVGIGTTFTVTLPVIAASIPISDMSDIVIAPRNIQADSSR